MDLAPYVEQLQRQLVAAASAGGDEAKALIERIAAPLEAAVRLALQDVLAAASDEITCELAPGSVELRLRGRDPEFVVTPPPADSDGAPADAATAADSEDSAIARVNVRMPEHLKTRVDTAATTEGVSVNAWLVRAAANELARNNPNNRVRRAPQTSQRFTGWAR
jgi:hypothetical protein